MSKMEIPESWAEASLEDCLNEFGRGKSPKYSEKDTGIYVVNQRCIYWDDFRPDNRKIGTKEWFNKVDERYRLRAGDILVNSTGTGTLGRAVCLKSSFQDTIPDSHVTLIRAKDSLHPWFLVSFLKSAQGQEAIEKATTGSTNQIELNKTKLGQATIPIPPLGEQKRIVGKIESAQEKIKTIEKSVTKAEELIGKYREALLQKAFRGELAPQDPNDEPASKLLERISADHAKLTAGKKKKKDDLLPIKPEEIPFEIPNSWEWIRAEVACEEIESGSTPDAKQMTNVGEIQFLKVYNLSFDGSLLGDNKATFIPKSLHQGELKRATTRDGDVLINIVGPPLGKVTEIKDTRQEFSHNQAIVHFRPSPNVLLQSYFSLYLQSNKGKEWLVSRAKKTSGQANLNVSTCRSMPIPLPPFKEQVRIIKLMGKMLESAVVEANLITSIMPLIATLKNAVLTSAYSGRLVFQDPTEGSGHELLEKIRQSDQSELSPNKSQPIARAKVKKKTRTKK